jgi:hypothetical protein
MSALKNSNSCHHRQISRRSLMKGAAGLAGSAALGATVGLAVRAQTMPVRMDIAEFAKDASRLAAFEGAVQEMMDRSAADPSDPGGWLAHANAHAQFCSIPNDDPQQVHFCWWFLPWHRAYIHVTELKIRELTGDNSFAYPYWNWSSDRSIPAAFARAGSPLANAIRNTPDRSVADGEVGYFPDDPTHEKLGVAALGAPFYEAKSTAEIGLSFGGIARPNGANRFGNNSFESVPHGPIHNYVGGPGGDMSDFETAGRDAIFFAHHGNLDRLWEAWRQDHDHRASEPTSDDFLKHKFPFVWLDGTAIEVAVEDTLDTTKLDFVYDTLDVFRPGPPIIAAQGAETRLAPVARATIGVPLLAQGLGEKERRILEITDVEKPEVAMSVGVYLKPASAPAEEQGKLVGSFAAVLAGGEVAWPTQTLAFDITDAANEFSGEELTVELIPYRLGEPDEVYPPLKYGEMRIVTKTLGQQ